MSKIEIITCDKCGRELPAINNAQISQMSARIDLYPIGQPRTYPSQRIDLCEECFNEFVNFMERNAFKKTIL